MLITLPNSCWLNPLPSMWSCLTFFSEGISKFPSLLQPGPVQNFFSLKSFMSATFPKLKRILRPRPPVSEYFWIRNFGSRQHVSDESGIRIRNFFNPLSRVEIFGICYEPGTRVDAAKSGYFFFISWRNKIKHNSFPCAEYSRWCRAQCYRFFTSRTTVSRLITCRPYDLTTRYTYR